jgi:hypothetical protein
MESDLVVDKRSRGTQVKRKPLDLSEGWLPHSVYFPHPTLIPGWLAMNAIGSYDLETLRRLAACSGDGHDQLFSNVSGEKPDTTAKTVKEGALELDRAVYRSNPESPDPIEVISWWAAIRGLAFKSDGECVYVEGADERIILFNPKAKQWEKPFYATVYESESLRGQPEIHKGFIPAGKWKTYLYADMVEARNATLPSRTHFRVPSAAGELMGATPSKPTRGKNKSRSNREIAVRDNVEQGVFGVKRVGKTVELKLDDATIKRMYGENGNSPQGVIRFEAPIEVASDEWVHHVSGLLRGLGTETLLVAYGLLARSVASGNTAQRLSTNDLARMRGQGNAKGTERRRFTEMAELLSKVIIEVTDPTSKSSLKIPLFRPYGTAKVAGGTEVPLVTMHEYIFDSMMASGHGIFHDQSMLLANLKTHEQAARIGMALQRQWSLGWVVKKQFQRTPLRRRVSVLLKEAVIDFDLVAEVKKRGKTATRLHFEGWLNQAKTEGWIGGWKAVKAGTTIGDDMYEYTPTDAFRRTLDDHRRPALR